MQPTFLEEKMTKLGINFPETKLTDNHTRFELIREYNDLLFVSGHGPLNPDGTPFYQGKLGSDLTVEQGYLAARDTGIIILDTLNDYLGGLDKIDSFVKVLGWVASSSDFHLQPKVMNGFSDLINDVFGERGTHARSAIGTNVLPFNIPVEIELIVKIKS